MMLLQGGQLGLYRRDSIWTDMLPPDMYAACTLWVDGTDSASLFSGPSLGGSAVTADGAAIWSIQNKVVPTEHLDQAGTSISQVVLKTGSAGAKSAIHMLPGILGSGKNLGVTSTGSMSDWVSAGDKLFVLAVKVNAAVDTSVPIGSNPIIGSTSLSAGIYVYEDGTPASFLLYGAVWNGGTLYYVETRLPRTTYVILTMQHQGGQLRMRINGGAWVTTACPSVAPIGVGAIGIGSDYFPTDFELAHATAFKTALTDASLVALERWLAADVGITPWW